MTTLGSEVGIRNPGSAHASYFSPTCNTVVTVCHPSDRPALSTVQPHFKDQPWNNRFDLAGSEPANLDKKAKADTSRSERPSTLTRFSRTLSRLFRLKSSGDRRISETPRSKSVYSSEVRENNRVSQSAVPAKLKPRGETRHLSCTCHMQSSSCSSGRLHRGRASGKTDSWTPVTTAAAPLVVDHGSVALCYPHRYTEVSDESQRRSQPRSQPLVQPHHQQQYPRSTAEQQQQSEVALLTPAAATVAPSGDCMHNCVHHIHHIHHVHHVHHHLHHMPLDGSALSEVAAAVATAAEGSGSRSPPPPPSAFFDGLPSDFTSSDAALVFQESRTTISSVVGNTRPGAPETRTSAASTAAPRVCPRIVESPFTKGQLSELTSPVNLGPLVSHTYSAYGVRSHTSVTAVTTSHSLPSVTCTASTSVAVPSALPHRQPSNICARGHCLVGSRYHVKGPSDANSMNSELAVAAVAAAAETGIVLNSPEVITGCCSAPLDSTGARLRSLSSSSPASASAATATNSSSPWTAAQSRTLPLVASSSQKQQQLVHRQVQHHMHHHHHVHHMATALTSPSSRQGASPLSPCTAAAAAGRITRVMRPPSSSLPSTSRLCQSPTGLATQAESVISGSFCTSRCGAGSGNGSGTVGGGSGVVPGSSPSPHSTTAVDHRSSFQESMKELRKMGWYWGPLSFTDAEVLLAKRPDGTFLRSCLLLCLLLRLESLVSHSEDGRFSFWYQPQTHSASTVVEFIEKAVAHSISGKFHYFLQTNTPGQNPVEVPLLYPLSRFQVVQSLKHLARFTILSHVRRDHVAKLPLPPGLIGYLLEKQVYWESLEEFEEFIRDRPPLHFVSCTSRSARALTPPPCSSPSPPSLPPPTSSPPGPLGLSSSPSCTTTTMATAELSRRPSPQPNIVIPARANSGPA
ncbi:negative regulation of STAT cascade [Sparganum proliferum]